MRILFDTNVVLDVLLDRRPYAAAASRLMVHVERGRIEGLLGATTVTTIHYLAAKSVGVARAKKHVQELLILFDIAVVDRNILSDALTSRLRDYEDAVLHEAARRGGAVGIVTRDVAGFAKATLKVYSPEELLHLIAATAPE